MSSVASFLMLILGAAASGMASAEGEASERLMGPGAAAVGGEGNDAPRIVRIDTPQSQPTPPGYSGQATALDYRWWLSNGRADLGLGIGTFFYGLRPLDSAAPRRGSVDAGSVLGSATVLTLGMRYRTSEHSALFADASGWRSAAFRNGDALVGKVGLEFKAARSRWNIAYGGLGLRLSGDTGMTLRLRRGGLAVYMRSTF